MNEFAKVGICVATGLITGLWFGAFMFHQLWEVMSTARWYSFPTFMTTVVASLVVAIVISRLVLKLLDVVFGQEDVT